MESDHVLDESIIEPERCLVKMKVPLGSQCLLDEDENIIAIFYYFYVWMITGSVKVTWVKNAGQCHDLVCTESRNRSKDHFKLLHAWIRDDQRRSYGIITRTEGLPGL